MIIINSCNLNGHTKTIPIKCLCDRSTWLIDEPWFSFDLQDFFVAVSNSHGFHVIFGCFTRNLNVMKCLAYKIAKDIEKCLLRQRDLTCFCMNMKIYCLLLLLLLLPIQYACVHVELVTLLCVAYSFFFFFECVTQQAKTAKYLSE